MLKNIPHGGTSYDDRAEDSDIERLNRLAREEMLMDDDPDEGWSREMEMANQAQLDQFEQRQHG